VLGLVVVGLWISLTYQCVRVPLRLTLVFRAAQDERLKSRKPHASRSTAQAKAEHHQSTTNAAAATTSLRESEPVTVPSVLAIRCRTPRARLPPPPSRPGQPLVSGFPSSPPPPSQEGKEDTSPWCTDFFDSLLDSTPQAFWSRAASPLEVIIICLASDDYGLTHRRAGSSRI
jgi:hypothetical protein